MATSKRATTLNYSTEELRERKALTDAIVANLKTIGEDPNDLDELTQQSSAIVQRLQAGRAN